MTAHHERIALVIPSPYTKKGVRIDLSPDVAAWLHQQLGDALGLPREKPRRPVRLHRGRWILDGSADR